MLTLKRNFVSSFQLPRPLLALPVLAFLSFPVEADDVVLPQPSLEALATLWEPDRITIPCTSNDPPIPKSRIRKFCQNELDGFLVSAFQTRRHAAALVPHFLGSDTLLSQLWAGDFSTQVHFQISPASKILFGTMSKQQTRTRGPED